MNELEKIEQLNPAVIFKAGGIQSIIDQLRAEVQSVVPDVSTAKGRKEVASLAFKIAKSKTLLDKMGKTLADELNAQLKPINQERKLARDELDKLRDEIRRPLTEWEEAEKARIKAEAERIAAEKLAEAERIAAEKLAKEVEHAHELGLLINDKITADRKAAAEAERIAAENARIENEKRIKENARIEAEKRLERERQAVIEREKKAERDVIIAREEKKRAAEKAKRDAEIARQNAEREKQAAIQAEKDKAEQARLDAERRAAAAERARLEKEAAARAASAAAAADKQNRINRCTAAVESLKEAGIDHETARTVVRAILNNKVANVTIIFE